MMLRTSLYIFMLLAAALILQQPVAADGPPVLAFYYAWFDQNTWTSGQSVDLPAEPYTSTDRAVIERHVAQAQGAGIDALVQSWYGPQEANNQTETNFRTLLDVAAGRGFHAAVHFEVTSPFLGDSGAVTNALASLIASHAQHPAYLRYQGKPVIFFWRQQRFGIETWAAIRQQVDPGYGTLWIAEGTDIGYQAQFDGHHLYSIAWAGSPADQLTKWGNRVRSYAAENGLNRLWVATAMPGYNDTRLPRSNAFAVSRRGGDYYRETFQGAAATQPDMIIITSFNEWLEGTQLEPSGSYGNLYLDLTRDLVSGLRSGGWSPPVVQVQAAAPETAAAEAPADALAIPASSAGSEPAPEIQIAAAPAAELSEAPQVQTPEGPYFETGSITNVRSQPDTGSDIVERLPAGATVSVVGRTTAADWWVIEAADGPDGQGWVSAEVVDFVGNPDEVPVVEPPPGEPSEIPAEAEATDPASSAEPADEPADDSPAPEVTADSETADATQETAETEASADAEEAASPGPTPVDLAPTGATITAPEDGVNVRRGPGLEFELLGRLDEGTEVPILGQNEAGDWWLVAYDEGDNGQAWVAGVVVDVEGSVDEVPVVSQAGILAEATVEAVEEATPTPAPPEVVGQVEATSAINVRAAPSTEAEIIGALYVGQTVEVVAVSQDGDWWQIELAEAPDQEAWVAAEFVEFAGEVETVPIFGLGTVTPTPQPTNTPAPTPT
ncbi:MAG TPA: endo-1,3-alpha-glucanase family glycosylhydrolase, partial [Anaerolineae bacterium]|nr:endo-1,3-alpha-glucanase family glycosylhydrolase [Anaerolineae bacterium]